MADINDGDVIRIAGVMKLDLVHEITNVWHLLVLAGGPMTFAAADADFQEYMDLMFLDIDTTITNNQTVDRLEIQNVTTDQVFGSIDWGAFAAGGNAQQHTALGVTAFCWGRTRTPRVQIRKYMGVFTEDDLVDGTWNAAILTDLQTMMDDHITPNIMAGGLELQGVAWNRTAKTYTLATSAAVAPEPAYQRRRKRGRGS